MNQTEKQSNQNEKRSKVYARRLRRQGKFWTRLTGTMHGTPITAYVPRDNEALAIKNLIADGTKVVVSGRIKNALQKTVQQ